MRRAARLRSEAVERRAPNVGNVARDMPPSSALALALARMAVPRRRSNREAARSPAAGSQPGGGVGQWRKAMRGAASPALALAVKGEPELVSARRRVRDARSASQAASLRDKGDVLEG